MGGIGIRAGVPVDVDQWGWSVGFYPGRHPSDSISGSAATYELCRAEWFKAWARYLPGCTEEAFQEWRDHNEWTTDKYTLWDAGYRNLTIPLKCKCGQSFDAGDREARRLHIPHLTGRNH